MMMPNPEASEYENKLQQVMTLFYTGPNGEHAKYSLYERIRTDIYKVN